MGSGQNAYTHDILEKKNLNVILGLMTLQSRIKLLNSNRAPVGEFSLKGAKEALSRFVGCMNPSNADMQIEHGRSFLTIGFRPAGATNLDDCAAVCRSESRCNAFQFHRNPVHDPRVRKNVQCLLFDDKSGLISVPSPEITIGTKLKLASAQRSADLNGSIQNSPHAPKFDHFPARSTYSRRVRMPDFSGRDRKHREYRTRIREALAKQRSSNFAGRFNLVPISLTGGVIFIVVDSKTGHIEFSDVLGGWPCDFAFKENSRLLVVQWSNAETCYIENFEWTGTQMRQVGEALEVPIDQEGYCRDALPGGDTSSHQ